jgi:hypothetical protein
MRRVKESIYCNSRDFPKIIKPKDTILFKINLGKPDILTKRLCSSKTHNNQNAKFDSGIVRSKKSDK